MNSAQERVGRQERGRSSINMASLALQLALLVPIVAFAVVVQWQSPRFLHLPNILQVLRQAAVPGIIAAGVTFVVVANRFDLSVGSILSAVAVLVVSLHPVLGPFGAVVVALAAGIVLGLANGLVVGFLGLNSVIATLGSLSVIQGLTLIYTGGANVQSRGVDPAGWFVYLGRGNLFGIPFPVIELLVVALVLEFLLHGTTFGRRVKATGGGETTARFSGINTRLIVLMCYVIASAATALAAVIFTARTVGAQNDAGAGYELTVLAAIILGGTSISGGAGSVLRSVAGVLVLSFIANGLLMTGLPFYAQSIVTWGVIIFAVAFDQLVKRRLAQ